MGFWMPPRPNPIQACLDQQNKDKHTLHISFWWQPEHHNGIQESCYCQASCDVWQVTAL